MDAQLKANKQCLLFQWQNATLHQKREDIFLEQLPACFPAAGQMFRCCTRAGARRMWNSSLGVHGLPYSQQEHKFRVFTKSPEIHSKSPVLGTPGPAKAISTDLAKQI